jgi:prefoldin subunit 5
MANAIARLQKKLTELESLREEAIRELLSQRAQLDAQLRELGFRRGRKPGKKRGPGRPKGSRNKKRTA